jgi:hypothetical protein
MMLIKFLVSDANDRPLLLEYFTQANVFWSLSILILTASSRGILKPEIPRAFWFPARFVLVDLRGSETWSLSWDYLL